MGKESSNNKNAKSRNNKPYDVSNSFVRTVANRVSGYFGSFFTSSEEASGNAPATATESDDPNPTALLQTRNTTETECSDANVIGDSQGDSNALTRRNNVFASSSEPQFISPIRHEPVAGPSGVKKEFLVSKRPTIHNDDAARYSQQFPQFVVDTPIDANFKRQRVESDRGNNLVSDDHSESSESTSGCSSLVPQADRMSQSAFNAPRKKLLSLEDKLGYARQLKMSRTSMYLNRSIPVDMDTLRPSRTPSFDVSAYGSPILNKSSVREAMLNSPFYSGHTTYGGASARRNSLCTPGRAQIPVKPAATAPEDLNMSHTARKILAALEEFSTPLSDVRRIPPPAALAAKRRSLEPTEGRPPKLPALAVPTVADVIKMRRLERIQESTEAARQVMRAESSQPRHSGKVVTKLKDRDKAPVDEPVAPLNLPQLHLPLSTLPKFDITPLQPSATITAKTFTFAAPSEIDSQPCDNNYSNSLNFAFSAPVAINQWQRHSATPTIPNLSSETLAKLKRKTAEQHESAVVAAAPELKKGSVMDILGLTAHVRPTAGVVSPSDTRTSVKPPVEKHSAPVGFGDKFKPVAGTWSCEACMVNNAASAFRCVACETPKPSSHTTSENVKHAAAQAFSSANSACNPSNSSTIKFGIKPEKECPQTGFGAQFKPAPGSWSCTDCLVSNKPTSSKCVSCGREKVESKEVAALPDDKLKFCSKSAACTSCGVDITAGSKCAACEKSKQEKTTNGPTVGFGDIGKKKSGSWECQECLVNNHADATSCVACEAKNPNAITSSLNSGPKFSFGIPSGASQFKFGIVEDSKSTQPLPNGPSKQALDTAASVPTSNTFSFGIPPMQKANPISSSSSETSNATNVSADTGQSSLVNESKLGNSSGNMMSTAKVGLFTFGVSTTSSVNAPTFNSFATSAEKTTTPVTAAGFGWNGAVVNKPGEVALPNKPVINSGIVNSGPSQQTPVFSQFPAPSFGSSFPTPPKPETTIPATPTFGSGGNNINPMTTDLFRFGSHGTTSKHTSIGGSLNAGAFTFNATPSVIPRVEDTRPTLPAGNSTTFCGSALPTGNSFAIPLMPGFGTSLTSTFGTSTTPTFGGFGAQPTATQQSFTATTTANTLFGAQAAPSATTPFGAQFGQTAAPVGLPTQTPFQFNAPATSFSLTVPQSFNFTSGQTPSFNAAPQPTEPRRRIIRARRTQR